MSKKTKSAKTAKRRVKVKEMPTSEKSLSVKSMKKIKGGEITREPDGVVNPGLDITTTIRKA